MLWKIWKPDRRGQSGSTWDAKTICSRNLRVKIRCCRRYEWFHSSRQRATAEPAMLSSGTPRSRGCQAPLSGQLIGSAALQLSLTAAAYICWGLYVQPRFLAIPLVLSTVPFATMLACWIYCVSVDPSKADGAMRCSRMSYTQAQERYCRQCAKTVPGLDHHCGWLNTCIGTRNYVPFFILNVAGESVLPPPGVVISVASSRSRRSSANDN